MKNYISFCPAAHQQPTEPSPLPTEGEGNRGSSPPSPMQRMGTAEFTALLLLLTQFPIPPHVTPRCPTLLAPFCTPLPCFFMRAGTKQGRQKHGARQEENSCSFLSPPLTLVLLPCSWSRACLSSVGRPSLEGEDPTTCLHQVQPQNEHLSNATLAQSFSSTLGGGNRAHKRQHHSHRSSWAPMGSSQPCLQPDHSSSSTEITHIHLATLGTAPASGTRCQ